MSQETKILLGIGILTIAIITGGVILFSGKSSGESANSNGDITKVDQKLLVKNNSHTLGLKSAKVTIVEFGDYQCPACKVAYPATKKIIKDYQNKILFVFRNFPLSQHQNAMIAAEAAEAAGSQGKFWEMHDLLYEKQSDWAEGTNPLDKFTGYAKTIGLDVNKFKQDLQNNKFGDLIQADTNDGNATNVNSTPTFFINGEFFSQDATYDNLKTTIDKKL